MRRVLMVIAVAMVLAPLAVAGQEWRDVTMSRQLENNDEVRVFVEYAAGTFKIRSLDDGLLYRMNLRYDEDNFEPVADFSGDRLRLGIDGVGRSRRIGKREAGNLDLELARGVPMELSLDFGAVKADIDLGGLALTRLDLETGASESLIEVSEPNPSRMRSASFEVGAAEFTVQNLGNLNAEHIEVHAGVGAISLGFGGRWQRSAEVEIKMGLGSLELHVPEGLGVQLRKESFLTSLDSEGLVKRGDVYQSLDFDDAEHRITIDLDAAFGSVKVIWIR